MKAFCCSLLLMCILSFRLCAQINTDRVMLMGRNALYYEDYVLSIQRFNLVINAKPYLAEPYFFRGLAKFYLEDFIGAEQDCTEAIERNPYLPSNYQLRALCRVNRKDYVGATADYRKLLHIEPRNRSALQNLSLCLLELDNNDGADSCLNEIVRYWPTEAVAYTLKAQVAVNRGDTLQMLKHLDKALSINPYEGEAWTMRSLVSLQRGQYQQAEDELDKAIVQKPRIAGNYINRALARYHQRNYRGAMADYDAALDIDPNNFLGHFNRGLLRARVGDDNRAIEDFDFVLKIEPDNMIALFNRALMLDNTGDYRGAIRDISAIIAENPQFWTGYQFRASVRRKVGDVSGAEKDEFRVMKAHMDKQLGLLKPSPHKTRKRSDADLNKYNQLVEADNEELTHDYASEYRGRVQNKAVNLVTEPLYVLTYYRKPNSMKHFIPYHATVEQFNTKSSLIGTLYLSNEESPLDEERLNHHFASIHDYTLQIDKNPDLEEVWLARALDYYHVRDFESALADLNHTLDINPNNVVALLARVQVRCKQTAALQPIKDTPDFVPNQQQMGYRLALKDLDLLLTLAPDFLYAYYNKGNIYFQLKDYNAAIESYTKAIQCNADFPDAYYNRGIANILAGNIEAGLSDLSRAGELGLYSAYNLIKRYSKQTSGKTGVN